MSICPGPRTTYIHVVTSQILFAQQEKHLDISKQDIRTESLLFPRQNSYNIFIEHDSLMVKYNNLLKAPLNILKYWY